MKAKKTDSGEEVKVELHCLRFYVMNERSCVLQSTSPAWFEEKYTTLYDVIIESPEKNQQLLDMKSGGFINDMFMAHNNITYFFRK